MNKIILALLSAIIIVSITAAAGCITEEKPDSIIGTWITENYTSAIGNHFPKIYETFFEDNSGVEKRYTDSNETVEWDTVWRKISENKYEIYYSPMTIVITDNGKTGTVYSKDQRIDKWVVTRETESNSVVGVWKGIKKYDFLGSECDLEAEFTRDGIVIVKLTAGNDPEYFTFGWEKLGPDTYVTSTSSDRFSVEIRNDGKMYDNFGCVYTKI